jgi:hypothetical protein
MNVQIELLRAFNAELQKDGSSLEKELQEIGDFRRAISQIPDVQGGEGVSALSAIISVLPPAHGLKLTELSLKKSPVGVGIKGVKEIIEDLGSGAEDFIASTKRALEAGVVSNQEGAGADFDSAMLEENMLRWVLLKRLAERREKLFEWARRIQQSEIFNVGKLRVSPEIPDMETGRIDAKLDEMNISNEQSRALVHKAVRTFADKKGQNIMSNIVNYYSQELQSLTHSERALCIRAIQDLLGE